MAGRTRAAVVVLAVLASGGCGEQRVLPPIVGDPEPGQPAQVGDAIPLGVMTLFGTAEGTFGRDALRQVSYITREDGSGCIVMPGGGQCSSGPFVDPATRAPFAFPIGATSGDGTTCAGWWASLDITEIRVTPDGRRTYRLRPLDASREVLGVQVVAACWSPDIDLRSHTVAVTGDGTELAVPTF